MRLRTIALIGLLALLALGHVSCCTHANKLQNSLEECSHLTWLPAPSGPLQIWVDPTAIKWLPLVQASIDEWNLKIPGVFVFAGVRSKSFARATDITVSEDWTGHLDRLPDSKESGALGITKGYQVWGLTHYKLTGCDFVSARIELNPSTPGDKWHRAILHELGHALGVNHSNADPHELMYPDTKTLDFFVSPATINFARQGVGLDTE